VVDTSRRYGQYEFSIAVGNDMREEVFQHIRIAHLQEDNHEIGMDYSANQRCKKKNRGPQMADENTELHGTISERSQSSWRPTCHPFILKHVTFSSAGDFVKVRSASTLTTSATRRSPARILG